MKTQQPTLAVGNSGKVLIDTTNQRKDLISRKRKLSKENHPPNKISRKDKIYVDPPIKEEDLKHDSVQNHQEQKASSFQTTPSFTKTLPLVDVGVQTEDSGTGTDNCQNGHNSVVDDIVDFCVSSSTRPRSKEQKVKDAVDMMTQAVPSPEYYELLAEKRRLALEETLDENARLTDENKTLKAENILLEEMVQGAKELAEMVQQATSNEEDDSDVSEGDLHVPEITFKKRCTDDARF